MTQMPHEARVRLEIASGASIEVRRVYSAVLEHAGVPFVSNARSTNGNRKLELRIAASEIAWQVESASGAVSTKSVSAFRNLLDTVSGTRQVRVEWTCAGETAAANVALTDPWSWAWFDDTMRLLPALVLPNDGVVRHVAGVARRMVAAAGNLSPERFFECLRDQFDLRYEQPVVEASSEAPPLQRLRAPHRVIADLAQGRGEGSCLDLTLLMAGCLEATGHAPILVLLPDPDGRPAHALLAWWRDQARRFRPLLDAAELQRRCKTGEMDALETTHACRDRGATLDAARSEARARLEDCPRALGIDVLASRPPVGAVTSFEAAHDAVVLAAIDLSESIARQAGSGVVETLHLVFGLLEVHGPTTDQLLAAAGVDGAQLMALCRDSIAHRSRSDRAGRTRGYVRCLDDSLQNARSQGATVIRESDLWWAILTNSSSSLQNLFDGGANPRRALMDALAHIAPSSRPGSTVF